MLGPVLGRLRSHLGSLIEELVDPWLARCESELRERRGAERQRDAGACPRSTTCPSPTACSSPRSTYAPGSRTPDPPSGVFDYAEAAGVRLRIDGAEIQVRHSKAGSLSGPYARPDRDAHRGYRRSVPAPPEGDGRGGLRRDPPGDRFIGFGWFRGAAAAVAASAPGALLALVVDTADSAALIAMDGGEQTFVTGARDLAGQCAARDVVPHRTHRSAGTAAQRPQNFEPEGFGVAESRQHLEPVFGPPPACPTAGSSSVRRSATGLNSPESARDPGHGP